MIQDDTGHLIFAKSISLVDLTVHLVESVGAWWGFKWAMFELGVKRVWLGGDAM